jgi:hypothetical protein
MSYVIVTAMLLYYALVDDRDTMSYFLEDQEMRLGPKKNYISSCGLSIIRVTSPIYITIYIESEIRIKLKTQTHCECAFYIP